MDKIKDEEGFILKNVYLFSPSIVTLPDSDSIVRCVLISKSVLFKPLYVPLFIMIFELFEAELTAWPIDLNGDWLEPSPPLSLPSPLTYITELSFNKSLVFSSRRVVFASAPLIAVINEKKIIIPTKFNRTTFFTI